MLFRALDTACCWKFAFQESIGWALAARHRRARLKLQLNAHSVACKFLVIVLEYYTKHLR